MEKIIYALNQINDTATEILKKFNSPQILSFYGPMGSGKTTLIKSLVQQLGGPQGTSSPTFGIVNEYLYPDGRLLGYHFDFYRLNDPVEALDLGLEDYLRQDAWIFIEWPEKVQDFLPEGRRNIQIKIIDQNTREINF